jgi:small basic protein
MNIVLPDQLVQILTAIAAAVLYALAGYSKSMGETFDKQKFITTIVIGVAVGIIQVIMGLTYDAAYTFAVSAGIIVIIENITKAVYRRLTAPKVKVMQPLAK